MSPLRSLVVGIAIAAGCVGAVSCAEEEPSGISTARSQMRPLVDAACDWMFGCCSPDELVYQVGTFTADADNCSERMLDAITSGVPLGLQQAGLSNSPAEGLLVLALSVNQDRVNVNGGAVQECADATADLACNSTVVPADPGATRCTPGEAEEVEVPCDPDEMFVGKQGVGDECSGQFECQPGLRCTDFGTAGVCARRAEVGENCFDDAECATGLICDYSDGTCSEGKLIGEACAFVDPLLPTPGTESIRCAEGLACDPTSLLCVGGFCSPGAPCNDIVADSDCPENYFCTGDLAGLLFTCQSPTAAGVACMRDETCASGYCDPNTATCGTLLADGDVCNFGDECSSGYCDFMTSTCAPTVGNGMACQSDEQCSAGYCDGGTATCTAYATEGGACDVAQCDPTGDLFCVDLTCQRAPFPNGTSCVAGGECQSGVCFMNMCSDGTPIGSACSSDGSLAPCVLGSFCDVVEGAMSGTCVELLRSGQACLRGEQCWGDCVVRFGGLMCDATPAFDLNEAWCDAQ